MTYQLSRRRAIELAVLGTASAVAGGLGLWRSATSGGTLAVPEGGADLGTPEVLVSDGELLHVNLVAAAGVRLTGRDTSALGYNGTSPGPTLRLEPGETLRVDLTNRLDEPTNLHVHGLHVSPDGNGDNVFVDLPPGETFRYEYRLPRDHPVGTFWYHPHRHGLVADQIFGGLAGAIIVAGDVVEAEFDADRVLVVSDITLDDEGRVIPPSFQQRMMGRQGRLLLVNGQLQPTLRARRGTRERWRVINACTSRFLRLRLENSELTVLSLDGHRLRRPARRTEVLLAPGNRADLSVEATAEGRYRILTEPYDRGGMGMGPMMRGDGMASEREVLAVFDVSGESPASEPLRWDVVQIEDLREVGIQARRALIFEVGMGGGMRFLIDGREFDHDRIDTRVRLGTVEEWALLNPSPMDHPFHLHVWPFQVIDDGTGPLPEPQWQDVINIPAGRTVRIRVRFADFGGRTVYHCHILDHEDQGMMGVVLAS